VRRAEAGDEVVLTRHGQAAVRLVPVRAVLDARARRKLLSFEFVTVSSAAARRVAEAFERWGKGVHPAGLNFGDCFAYEVAREHACRLLFVGDDFSKTDLGSVL
jgi:ribonuclease VapC